MTGLPDVILKSDNGAVVKQMTQSFFIDGYDAAGDRPDAAVGRGKQSGAAALSSPPNTGQATGAAGSMLSSIPDADKDGSVVVDLPGMVRKQHRQHA